MLQQCCAAGKCPTLRQRLLLAATKKMLYWEIFILNSAEETQQRIKMSLTLFPLWIFPKKLPFGLSLGPGTKPVVWFCLGKIHSPFILIHSHTHYIYTVIQILQMPRQVKTSSYLCLWWLASVFSRMSNFVLNLNLYCPLSQQNRPAQQHSILQLTLRKTFWNCIKLSRNSQLSRCVALWNDNSFWLLFPGAWV